MDAKEIDQLRNRLADSDIRRATKHGEHLVCQTSEGTVEIRRTETGYDLVRQGLNAKTLASGPKATIRQALAPLYVITFA